MVQRRPTKGTDAKGNVTFIARWKEPDGTQRQKSFSNAKYKKAEKVAKDYESKMRTEVTSGSYIAPQERQTTLGQLIDQTGTLGTHSHQQHYKQLKASLGQLAHMPINEIKASHLNNWIAQQQKDYSKHTVASRVSKIKRIFKAANGDGLVVFNPTHSLNLKQPNVMPIRKQDLPNPADFEQIVAVAAQGGTLHYASGYTRRLSRSPWLKDVVDIAANTGMRVSEIAGLEIKDINFMRRVIAVRAQSVEKASVRRATKTQNAVREIPINDALLVAFDRILASRGSLDHDRLIVGKRGNPVSGNQISTIFSQAKMLSGVKGNATLHGLRHRFGSELVASGVPLVIVAELMGHSHVLITSQRYVHFLPGRAEQYRSAVDSLGGFLGDCGGPVYGGGAVERGV